MRHACVGVGVEVKETSGVEGSSMEGHVWIRKSGTGTSNLTRLLRCEDIAAAVDAPSCFKQPRIPSP